MPDLPPLDALRVFDAAARRLSFAAAADDLHLTASAVSHRIKALEALLGVRLFDRGVRKVSLTAEGRRYAAAVADAIAIVREATRRLTVKESRPFTVSVTPLFGVRWLLPRVARFEALYPDLPLRLISTMRLANFGDDGIDCAIRYGRGGWKGLHTDRLMSLDFIPVCAPALLRGPRALERPEDLARQTLLHYEGLPDAWQMWLHAAGVNGVDAELGQVFPDMPSAIQAAIDGRGVAISDRKFFARELAEGWLAVPFEFDMPAGGAFYFVYPERRGDDARIARFREWVLAEVAGERDANARARPAARRGVRRRA